jgi:hypothetical protein
VRTYANLLKLNAAKLIDELDAELRATEKFADQTITPEKKKGGVDSLMLLLSRLNWGVAAVLIGLALIVLGANAGYRAFKNRKASDPLKKLSSGMYQPAGKTGEMLPLPTNIARPTP